MGTKESIDDMLRELVDSTNGKEVEVRKETSLDVSDKEDLARELVKLTQEDRKMADKLFELFYPEILSGMDKSQASKEALTRALELKISAGRNIIDLMKIMKQEEKVNNSIGIFFNEKKSGIDTRNILDSYEEDDD